LNSLECQLAHLKDLNPVGADPATVHMQLGHLIAETPNLNLTPLPDETMIWLARVEALVCARRGESAANQLRPLVSMLINGALADSRHNKRIMVALYRAQAVAELAAPAGAQGAFIHAGSVFDAMAMVGKVIQSGNEDVLIVDPYMDETSIPGVQISEQ
jgi:hypothetical protein